MFPELTHDEIFRIETPRLWLRWPRAADVNDILRYANDPEVALKTAVIPYPYTVSDAEMFVLNARTDNAKGAALHLALTPKRMPGEAIGMISLGGAQTRGVGTLGFVLARRFWGQGYMTEAATAFVDLVFSLTSIGEIASSALPSNLASQRVLEKVGFERVGNAVAHWAARGGDVEVERFMLKRGARLSPFAGRRPLMTTQGRSPS